MVKYYLFGGGHLGEFVMRDDGVLAEVRERPRFDLGDQVLRPIDEEFIFLVRERVIDGVAYLLGVYGDNFPDEVQVRAAILRDARFER